MANFKKECLLWQIRERTKGREEMSTHREKENGECFYEERLTYMAVSGVTNAHCTSWLISMRRAFQRCKEDEQLHNSYKLIKTEVEAWRGEIQNFVVSLAGFIALSHAKLSTRKTRPTLAKRRTRQYKDENKEPLTQILGHFLNLVRQGTESYCSHVRVYDTWLSYIQTVRKRVTRSTTEYVESCNVP